MRNDQKTLKNETKPSLPKMAFKMTNVTNKVWYNHVKININKNSTNHITYLGHT